MQKSLRTTIKKIIHLLILLSESWYIFTNLISTESVLKAGFIWKYALLWMASRHVSHWTPGVCLHWFLYPKLTEFGSMLGILFSILIGHTRTYHVTTKIVKPRNRNLRRLCCQYAWTWSDALTLSVIGMVSYSWRYPDVPNWLFGRKVVEHLVAQWGHICLYWERTILTSKRSGAS